MDKKLVKIARGCVYNVNYHIVFSPKRRKAVLIDEIAEDLKRLILDTVVDMGGTVESLEVMPDHVHLFVSIHPKISPYKIVKNIKGRSSNELRKKYPELLKLPCLWSGAYYVGSLGHVSTSVVKAYIENQKGK